MKVFLLKDVAKIGMAGEVVKVSDGYAANFLFPRKLAVQVTPENEASFEERRKKLEKRESVIETQTSMLAERIKSLTLTLKRKIHDGGKLYGSVAPQEIVDLLADKGVSISKNQVIFGKTIKEKGTHSVTIKLSSRLQPVVTVKILAEE